MGILQDIDKLGLKLEKDDLDHIKMIEEDIGGGDVVKKIANRFGMEKVG